MSKWTVRASDTLGRIDIQVDASLTFEDLNLLANDVQAATQEAVAKMQATVPELAGQVESLGKTKH